MFSCFFYAFQCADGFSTANLLDLRDPSHGFAQPKSQDRINSILPCKRNLLCSFLAVQCCIPSFSSSFQSRMQHICFKFFLCVNCCHICFIFSCGKKLTAACILLSDYLFIARQRVIFEVFADIWKKYCEFKKNRGEIRS